MIERLVGPALARAAPLYGSREAAQAVRAAITHQGRLYDATDKPITGTLAVKFAIYADATTATAVWTETDTVTFDEGYFSVSIGDATAFGATLFDG